MAHRTKAELQAHRASLTVALRACGHVGVAAKDYYTDRWCADVCVDCYQKAERERQRAYRGGKPAGAVLATAGHEYEIDEQDNDSEYQAALGVLRDRRAQREGKQGYVYLITEDLPFGVVGYGKIGYSVNPKKRVAELQTGNPRKLRLLYAMPGTEEDEKRLHTLLAADNVMQEWFTISPLMILQFPPDTAVH